MTEIKNKPKCRDCIYLHKFESHGETVLACHRLPPSNGNLWPLVGPDDWCGEFRKDFVWPPAIQLELD